MEYRKILIQTYRARGENSGNRVRAKPLPGQGVDADIKVECSTKMRNNYPVGTIFEVMAKLSGKDDAQFLYTSWQWDYRVVGELEAKRLIAAGGWR